MEAFEMITIPAREEKPRKIGLTTLLDRGLGYHAASDLVEQAADYIDLIKLGWGIARLIPQETLKKKIALYRDYQIMVSNGGTILELAYQHGKVKEFFASRYARPAISSKIPTASFFFSSNLLAR